VSECEVWWAGPQDAAPEHVRLLNAAESGRRERYLRDLDRDRFTLGVAMTRLALGAHLGIPPQEVPIDRTCDDCGKPHGKPRLADGSGPHVSVSHSGGRIGLALSPHGPVGLDVEAADRRLTADLEKHVLSPGERRDFEAAGDRMTALLTYWTRKEAVLKATGDGLRVPMPHLTFTGPGDPAPRLLGWTSRPDQVARVTLRPLNPGDGHVACLALLDQPEATVRERRATELLRSAATG
jgi:4'-phosphopantetheinyl transferase